MYPVWDVSSWQAVENEQMGQKAKVWYTSPDGEEYLFKRGRENCGENWSEKCAAEVAATLDIPHAEIQLAEASGQQGTISRRFTQKGPWSQQILVHGNELLFRDDPQYPKDGPNFRVSQHTLPRILDVLAKVRPPTSAQQLPFPGYSAIDVFTGYLMLDALISNTDRHHANWAVIEVRGPSAEHSTELAPTFDHASSLGRELSDTQRATRLRAEVLGGSADQIRRRRPQTVVGYLDSPHARSRIYSSEYPSAALSPMAVFANVFRLLPPSANAWLQVLESVPLSRFNEIFSQVPASLMSQVARDFCMRLMELNRQALLDRSFRYV